MKEALKADRPIYCYKLMRRYRWEGSYRFISPVMDHEYIPDTVMFPERVIGGFVTKMPEGMCFAVSSGFHSYASMDTIEFDAGSCASVGIVLAKCRIPRGSYYWKGTRAGTGRRAYDEYCSDRIEFVAWSEPDRVEWRRPDVRESHKAKMRLLHPEMYGESVPRKTNESILNGLGIEEAAGRLSGYSLCGSYTQGNVRVYRFRSSEHGFTELHTIQGRVRGVTLF